MAGLNYEFNFDTRLGLPFRGDAQADPYGLQGKRLDPGFQLLTLGLTPKLNDHVSFNLKLGAGEDMAVINRLKGGLLMPEDGTPSYLGILDAYVEVKAPLIDKKLDLAVKLGHFESPIGEVVERAKERNITPAAMTLYAIPVTLTGAMAALGIVEKLTFTVGAVRNWDVIPDDDTGTHLLYGASFATPTPLQQDKFTLTAQGLYHPGKKGAGMEEMGVHDLWSDYVYKDADEEERFAAKLNFNLGQQGRVNDDKLQFWGVAFYLSGVPWKAAKKSHALGLSGRYDYFSEDVVDGAGVRTALPANAEGSIDAGERRLHRVTGTLRYFLPQVGATWDHQCEVRAELSYADANDYPFRSATYEFPSLWSGMAQFVCRAASTE